MIENDTALINLLFWGGTFFLLEVVVGPIALAIYILTRTGNMPEPPGIEGPRKQMD